MAETQIAAEWVNVASLVPWDRNPRINDHSVDRVARSIIALGWGEVIVARREDNTVIAGHTRLKGAVRLPAMWESATEEERSEWSDDARRIATGDPRVPVRYLDIDRASAEKLAIASNKLGELSVWDEKGLAKLIADMDVNDIVVMGFSDADVAVLIKLAGDSWATDGVANLDDIGDYDPAAETFVIKIDKVAAADKERVLQIMNDALSSARLQYAAKAF